MTWGSWGDLKVKHLQWPMRRPPDGVCDTVTRMCVPWMASEGSTAAPYLSVVRHTSGFGWSSKEVGVFGSDLQTEDAGHALTSSLSSMGGIMGQNGPSEH